jgi:hypothetical protein
MLSRSAYRNPMGDYPQPYRDKLWCARGSGEVDEPERISIGRRADAKKSDDWFGAWGMPLGAIR